MLFVPGSHAAWLSTVHVYGADIVMFDLEDAVSLREKDTARLLVREALMSPIWKDRVVAVRINAADTPMYRQDLEAIVPAGVGIVRLPMVTDAQMMKDLDRDITEIEQACGREVGSTKIMAAIESASGVVNAVEIAKSSPRMVAIALAAYDYLVDMHTERGTEGSELFYARAAVLHAARVAGLRCYDVVYGDVENDEGFLREVRLAKRLGFDGKSLINPRQIEPLHNEYAPTEAEVVHAKRVIAAAEAAEAQGLGVVSLDGKLVDGPIITSARRIVALADLSGARR